MPARAIAEADSTAPREAPGPGWLVAAFATADAGVRRAILQDWVATAAEPDAPFLLRLLADADGAEAQLVLPFFILHPSPGALPYLRRFYDEPRRDRLLLAEALAAGGDLAVVDAASGLFAHPWSVEDFDWALEVVAHSPLPETARRVLDLDLGRLELLLASYADPGNVNPIRREVLAALLGQATGGKGGAGLAVQLRDLAQRLLEQGDESARSILDQLPEESIIVN